MTAPTTPAQIAGHRDVAAVFVFTGRHNVPSLADMGHGSHPEVWRQIAKSFAQTCYYTNVVEHAALYLDDDAQVLRFVRDDERALVVVLISNSALTKSILRSMRSCLRNLAKVAEREVLAAATAEEATVTP